MRNTFINTLSTLAKDDDSIYIVSGDAGYGVFEEFRDHYPDRFINAGVAEANMIGYSAGMALTGFNVFVYNIIPFVLYRCYEQVRNDICYQKLPVTLVGIGSGITYAPQGMTHYSVEDITLASTLPNLTVISPIDPVEVRAAVNYAAQASGPVYIRLAKTGEPDFRTSECNDILEPAVIRDGEDAIILSYGSIFGEAAEAADILDSRGIHVRLVSVPVLQPFPKNRIAKLISGFKTVITLEEHYHTGGLTSRMAELFVSHKITSALVPLTIPDQFIHHINKQAGLRNRYNIDAQAVVRAVISSRP